jgi:hypothetical protein
VKSGIISDYNILLLGFVSGKGLQKSVKHPVANPANFLPKNHPYLEMKATM